MTARDERPWTPRPPAAGCPDCGKVRYLTRAEAKRVARSQGRQRSRAYRCGDFWHLTHWMPEPAVTYYRERR